MLCKHNVATQPEAVLSPVTASAPAMAAKRGSSRRSALLQSFSAIHLSEMDHVALLRRTDTKYLLSEEQFFQALAHLTGHYRILEISGCRLHRYQTLYYDTQNLALYRQHHDGWRNRYKVRKRAYTDSDLAFLEVKHKVNANTTIKSRRRTRGLSSQIARDAGSFLRTHYPYQVEELEAKLVNAFQRITLVSTHSVERLTVDVDLRFLWNGLQLSLGFLLNFSVALLIIRGIYYPTRRSKEYVLTFFTLNTSVFLISSLLGGIDLSVGFGFSLFAIFSVLRYRTDPIPVREMTYLFVLMSLPVIDAVLLSQSDYLALLIANGMTVLVLVIGEKEWGCHYDEKKSITYEKIDLIKPENYDRLLADLRERTGLPVTRCEIGRIDFLRDVAELKIYYQQGSARLPQRHGLSPRPVVTSKTRSMTQ
jgi:hypothetical protein